MSLFCTQENGILIQDSFPLSDEYNCLLGIEVPYHYFVRKVSLFTHYYFLSLYFHVHVIWFVILYFTWIKLRC